MDVVLKRIEGNATVVVPDGMWIAKAGPSSSWSSHWSDQREPAKERPHNVLHQTTYQVLGLNRPDVNFHLIEDIRPDYCASITQHFALIADRPFVIVATNGFPSHPEMRATGLSFIPGRQVHKGELGRQPIINIELPQTVRREEQSWITLQDLCRLTGRTVAWLLEHFADFSPSSYNRPNVPVLTHSERWGKVVRVYPGSTVPETNCWGELNWSDRQITVGDLLSTAYASAEPLVLKSWAATVLRLLQFGYRPNEAPNGPSFKMEAPIPDQPVRALPVVPVEEMCSYSVSRPSGKEARRKQFRAAVERVLQLTEEAWTERPDLSDELNGFASRVKPRVIEGFGGRLQIILYYWTRAGHGNVDDPDEVHWMADISVHPGRPCNPRTTPAAYRLMIWPDQIQRVAPFGSVGGLTPPDLDPAIATAIRQITSGLGYTI